MPEGQAGILATYGIEQERFVAARRALATFDCNRDDAEFFLLSLLPVLLGKVELVEDEREGV